MKSKSRKSGISLISLIITIIVIIILAAIVIFSGMNTPEKAQLSKVISDIDNVQTAVDQAYYGLYTEKAVAGEVWTKSQFYEAVATGKTNREDLKATGLVEIVEDSLVKINLPKYEGRKWYIAVSDVSDTVKTGSAVLSPGFESAGKVYATLLDVQSGGSDGAGLNGENQKDENAITKVLQVGNYVKYVPDIKTYSTDIENTGYTSQTLTTAEDTVWRVLYIDTDANKVLITTQGVVNSGTYLSGIKGYLKGASELNKICANLYSNSRLELTARSMAIEDLEKACGITEIYKETAGYAARRAYYPYGIEVSGPYVSGPTRLEYNGNMYLKVEHEYSTAKFYTYDGGGEKMTDDDGFTYYIPQENNPVYVTKTSYRFDPSKKNSIVSSILDDNFGWLASSCLDWYGREAIFDMYVVRSNFLDFWSLYFSNDNPHSYNSGIRPLVELKSTEIKLTGSGDGSSVSPYEIIKK